MTKSKKHKPVTNQVHTVDGEGLILINQIKVYPYHGINYMAGVADLQHTLYVDVDSVAFKLQHSNSFRSLIRRTCRRDKSFIIHRRQSYLYNSALGALFDNKTVTKWLVRVSDVEYCLHKSSDANSDNVLNEIGKVKIQAVVQWNTYKQGKTEYKPFEKWLDDKYEKLAKETKEAQEQLRLNHVIGDMTKPDNSNYTYVKTYAPATQSEISDALKEFNGYKWSDDLNLDDLPFGEYKVKDDAENNPADTNDDDEKGELYKTIAQQNIQISSLRQSNHDLRKMNKERKRRIKKLTVERDGWQALADEWQVSYEEDLKHSGIHGWFYERFFSKEAKLRRKVRKHGVQVKPKEDDK